MMSGSVSEKVFLKDLGRAVRRERLKHGWTLENIEELGYPSWRHFRLVEAGKNVTLATLYRICKILKIRPAKLLKFEEKK